jgi:hypothetical protein
MTGSAQKFSVFSLDSSGIRSLDSVLIVRAFRLAAISRTFEIAIKVGNDR